MFKNVTDGPDFLISDFTQGDFNPIQAIILESFFELYDIINLLLLITYINLSNL